MNMFKKTGGFTLVELIVVIAILAILAAVAVPAYSGYIKKAQDAAVITDLDAIATAAQAANATGGAVTEIKVNAAGTEVEITAATYSETMEADFALYYDGASEGTAGDHKITLTKPVTFTGTSYAAGATWSGAKWTANTANNG